MDSLTGDLERDLVMLQGKGNRTDDWTVRRLRIGGASGTEAALIYVEGLVDGAQVQSDILARLMVDEKPAWAQGRPNLADLAAAVLPVRSYKLLQSAGKLRQEVGRGQPVLLVAGNRAGLALGVEKFKERNIDSPPNESGVRGARDGFVENLNTNLSLVRRRLSDRSLQVEMSEVGRRSQTRVALLFVADLAEPELVQVIRDRLERIDYPAVPESTVLGRLLTDQRFNPFPLFRATERPDKVQAALLAGRLAVLIDGSPGALLFPTVLFDYLWAPDDYYSSPVISTMVRAGRLAGLLAVVFLPALYVAVELYNPGLLHTSMAIFLAGERTGLPLNAGTEIVFLEIMMEMIHEATLRLPSKVGSAATVVGGLIIGQAAVQARLISSVVIIVVAVATIGSFTFPDIEIARVWRAVKWVVVISAILFGLYGVFISTVCMVLYLNSLTSFGVPYLAPIAPPLWRDLLRDFLTRIPWPLNNRRPDTYPALDPTRGPGLRRKRRP